LARGETFGRTASERARDSRAGDDRPLAPAPELAELLSGALQRLAGETRASTAAAWVQTNAEPVLVASFGEASPDTPSAAALDALFARSGATDLGDRELDASLVEYGSKAGFTAAAPLHSAEPIAAIFLGPAPDERAEEVRPRTLAALDHFVDRLREPAVTATTVARLARMEHEMLRLTRLATMGDLLAEAVHEIRNPLVSVKTFLQLLPENLDDRDFTENFREVVIEEVRRMERLLDSILQQARPKPVDAEDDEAAVGAVIESVGRLLEKRAQEKRLRLVVDVGADLPKAAIGEDPLRQIVLNLLLNAFEATPEYGRVALTASLDSEVLVLAVDDEGPGVPEAERARLFDPFFSTRGNRPVGLGLTVCRRLVDAASGTICVEDASGGAGARFWVRLPIA
jgi:signal transduction histidine kinase